MRVRIAFARDAIASAPTVARLCVLLTLPTCEQHHRVHRRRDHARDPHGHPQRGSCAETFRRLCGAGVSPDTLVAAIRSMRVELVFTAHPTEIVRRTLLQKHNRIAEMLAVDRST
jgi:phosphoenolpyruvate carboxylase